ncbi:Thylakoid lumenal protein 2, chloroplastic, partial [Tetrabaena socialis]
MQVMKAGSPFGTQRPAVSRPLTVAASARHASEARPASVEMAKRKRVASAALAAIATVTLLSSSASARPTGVNRPELLPSGDVTSVIDVAGFLAPSEEKRIINEVSALEQDTGFKLRVLAQNYPETPGLAIREYWGVDDNTIVFVADPSFGDILNFNVGAGIDLEVPRSFWGRLAGKFGNKFYWQENGEAASILNA